MHLLCYFVAFTTLVNFVYSAKILAVFPSNGYSQFILCEKLMTELAQKGHEVTVISPFKPKEEVKNYRTLLTDGIFIKEPKGNLIELESLNMLKMTTFLYEFTYILTDYILSDNGVQNLINSNKTFDLVIIEQFGNEAHMGFAKQFDAPLITFSSLGLSDWTSHFVGNVRLPSLVPLAMTPYSSKMSFYERLQNSLLNVFDIFYKRFIHFPKHQELVTKYFPKQINLNDVMHNVSLILMNSHVSTTDPVLLTSAIVEIGGFHVATKKLPADIKKFLDEADNGAILFSLGSNIESKNLPEEKFEAILRVFAKLKQKVLWKFEVDNMSNKPDNLFISKWLPQSDILAHPNLVAFITHAGLLSTTESIYHGVPMIGIPMFADQRMNIRRAVEKGIAVSLSFQELSEDTLAKAVNEVVGNTKYREASKKYSNIMRDRPVKPLDLAVYWIEHILRYGGGNHLRNSSMDLNWFQLYLLDVVVFVISIIVLIIFIMKYILTRIFCSRIPKEKFKKT